MRLYQWAGLAAAIAAAALWITNVGSRDQSPRPKPAHPPRSSCTPLDDPPHLLVCEDGTGWYVDKGAWLYAGPVTPVPGVPQR